MGRFLILLSYVGTSYRGIQAQRQVGMPITTIKTVQGVLEETLKKLLPANEVKIKISSRTDSNVHALCNAVHVDLVCRPDGTETPEFDPHIITSRLNYYLKKMNESISVIKTVRVADDFISRKCAAGRSYVYRLAVIKDLALYDGFPWTSLDAQRSQRIFPPFDVEMFLQAAGILSGSHNFLSFTTKLAVRNETKTISSDKTIGISVKRSSAFMEEHQASMSEGMEFWEVHFDSKSFLYKQVRRMMGAMVAVARGKMSLDQLQSFLDNPSLDNPGAIEALPGQGLYLKNVHFPEEVFRYEPEKSTGDDVASSDTIASRTEELSQENVAVPSSSGACGGHLPLHTGVSFDQLQFGHQNTNEVSTLPLDFQSRDCNEKLLTEAEINAEFTDQSKIEDKVKNLVEIRSMQGAS